MIHFAPESTWGTPARSAVELLNDVLEKATTITGVKVIDVEAMPDGIDRLTIEWNDGKHWIKGKVNFPAGKISLGDTVTIEADPITVLRRYPVMGVPPLSTMRDRAIAETMEHDA